MKRNILIKDYKLEHIETIRKAYEYADYLHAGQTRQSGEPYIIHPVSVAKIVLDYGMDCASVVAALLHDTVEDTDLTLEELDEIFGEEITHLVDGLTKLGKVPLDIKDKEEQQRGCLHTIVRSVPQSRHSKEHGTLHQHPTHLIWHRKAKLWVKEVSITCLNKDITVFPRLKCTLVPRFKD